MPTRQTRKVTAIATPKPIQPYWIDIGEVVMLASGGHPMTITKIDLCSEGGGNSPMVECIWASRGYREIETRELPAKCLKPYQPPKDKDEDIPF